jgi:hypothetical protein
MDRASLCQRLTLSVAVTKPEGRDKDHRSRCSGYRLLRPSRYTPRTLVKGIGRIFAMAGHIPVHSITLGREACHSFNLGKSQSAIP